MKETKTIYVYLPDEGTPVWRPVQAELLAECTFRIPLGTQVPDEETWQFAPGDVVRCKIHQLAEGAAPEDSLVAYERVDEKGT